jgi:PAS domain S-box-containing protein
VDDTKAGLEAQLEEAKKEIAYYRRLSEEGGDLRLREAEELSGLIAGLKKAEKELENARDELERRVEERTYELRRANSVLRQEMLERRRVEEALIESEEKYRNLFTAESDAILLSEKETGEILEVNDAASLLYGYTHEEMGRLKVTDISAAPEGAGMAAGTPSGRSSLGLHKRKDGSVFPADISASTFFLNGREVILLAVRDATERTRAEEQIRSSLKEKEVLLKEIHHRVKNNLQVVSSLLKLQAQQHHDKKVQDMFTESIDRIKTIASIHEMLYRSADYTRIDFGAFIDRIVSQSTASYPLNGGRVGMKTDVADISVDLNTAVPCGMLINELVSNAAKHAFPAEREGHIAVIMRQEEGDIILTVSDDGIGFPDHIDYRNTESLGMQLVLGLVDQLDGTIDFNNTGGTAFTITFRPHES